MLTAIFISHFRSELLNSCLVGDTVGDPKPEIAASFVRHEDFVLHQFLAELSY